MPEGSHEVAVVQRGEPEIVLDGGRECVEPERVPDGPRGGEVAAGVVEPPVHGVVQPAVRQRVAEVLGVRRRPAEQFDRAVELPGGRRVLHDVEVLGVLEHRDATVAALEVLEGEPEVVEPAGHVAGHEAGRGPAGAGEAGQL